MSSIERKKERKKERKNKLLSLLFVGFAVIPSFSLVAASCGSTENTNKNETEKSETKESSETKQSTPASQPTPQPAPQPQSEPKASAEASAEVNSSDLGEAGIDPNLIDQLDTESDSDTPSTNTEPETEEDKKWRKNPKVKKAVDLLKSVATTTMQKYGKNKKIVRVVERLIIKGLEKIIIAALKKQNIIKSEKLEALIYTFLFRLVKKQVGKSLNDKDIQTVSNELKNSIKKLKISSTLK